MNRWQNLFEQHPIHGTLRQLYNFANTEVESVDEEVIYERRRFTKVIASFENDLNKFDPEVIPFQVLDKINLALSSDPIFTQMHSYGTTGRAKNIRNANDQLNAILPSFASLYPQGSYLIDDHPSRELEKSFDNFVSTISSQQQNLQKEIQTLLEQSSLQESKLSTLSTDIDNRKKELNELIATWQRQFSEGQDKRQQDYAAAIEKYRDDTISWLAKLTEDTADTVQDAITQHNTKLQTNQSEFDKKTSTYLEEAENKHKAILELYELTAGDSVASAYVKSANDEKHAADLWRRISVTFIIGTIIWLLVSYFIDNPLTNAEGIAWLRAIKSLSITGALLFGAIYSSRQSNAHRSNEQHTRWFALEMKAIDPFISSLSLENQKELKNKLTEKLFGQQTRINEKEHPHTDEHFLEMIFKGVVDIIKAK